MTNKRILLIHNDRLLLKLYREQLEENGFVVEAIREMEQAQKAATDRIPDVVLLDLVFPSASAFDFISALRVQPATSAIPILVLPTALVEYCNAALQAGATRLIQPGGNPIAGIINAIRVSLGQSEIADTAGVAMFKPDDFWVETITSTALENINQMRHCLPGIGTTPPEPSALREMWLLGHAFAEKASLLPYKPLAQLTGTLDPLLHDQDETPEQLNPSTVRTVGQALDFLAAIAKPACLRRLADPSSTDVLVVDDEQSAREIISAALHLAGIRCECAATPSDGLGKVNGHRPNLIFLDVGLPEMNGFELCTKIRAIDSHKKTPIVFITGMATFQNKAKASLSGGNDFVGKPFNLPELGVKALMWLYRGQLEMV